MVSVIRMPAAQAFELCLCRTILRFAVSADRAGLTRIGRRHFYDGSAIELSFPVEFGKEETPTLIEYGSVETALLLHMSARFFRRPFLPMPSGSVSIFVSRVVFKGAANHGCPSCIGG